MVLVDRRVDARPKLEGGRTELNDHPCTEQLPGLSDATRGSRPGGQAGRSLLIDDSNILYYTILYYTILYYTILYSTLLYYTILYYTILYYTIV